MCYDEYRVIKVISSTAMLHFASLNGLYYQGLNFELMPAAPVIDWRFSPVVRKEFVMSASDNKELQKKVRAQIARRYIDTSMLTISVIGGNVRLTGVVSVLRSNPNAELKSEMEQISMILRTVSGVRDVTWDVTQRS